MNTIMHLDTKGAAQLLGVSPRTLEGWRVRGGGPVFRSFGRIVRYERESLITWAASRSRRSTSDAGSHPQ